MSSTYFMTAVMETFKLNLNNTNQASNLYPKGGEMHPMDFGFISSETVIKIANINWGDPY